MFSTPLWNLAVALGIGLLIGVERERLRAESQSAAPAGIRTFAIASLSGGLGILIGGAPLLAVATGAVALLAALSYWRTIEAEGPGLTTEIALVITVLLGGLSMKEPTIAGAVGVTVAVLLAARTRIHRFVGTVLTETEIRSALILAAATVVVLPLLPDQQMGPFDALNPRSIWRLVILVLAIGVAGHVAVRAMGPRMGLAFAGLASGFVSSSATIGAMGSRVKATPGILIAATAGAVLSTVATVVQMAIVVSATSLPAATALSAPLICAGAAAGLYGLVFTVMALRQPTEGAVDSGAAVSLKVAIMFALTLSVVLVASAALREWFGEAGSIVAAGLAGLVNSHAPAISIASLVASGKMSADAAVIPILAALSTNTLTKVVLAFTTGGRAFAIRVVPGLILVLAMAWIGVLAGPVVQTWL